MSIPLHRTLSLDITIWPLLWTQQIQPRTAIAKQGTIIGSHEQTLGYLLATVSNLSDEQAKMQSAIQAVQASTNEPTPGTSAKASATPPPPQPVAVSESPLMPVFRDAASPEPEPFSGNLEGYSGFLLQCELAFGI